MRRQHHHPAVRLAPVVWLLVALATGCAQQSHSAEPTGKTTYSKSSPHVAHLAERLAAPLSRMMPARPESVSGDWASLPPSVEATRVDHPYNPVIGKLFTHFDGDSHQYLACTATVVMSGNHSTVWTSAHCIDKGTAGRFRYGEFVPAFNDRGGADLRTLNPWDPQSIGPHAPYGVFPVARVWSPAGWSTGFHGQVITSDIAGLDYGAAQLHTNSAGATVEQAIGGRSARLSFDPPLDQVAVGVSVVGYPQEAPYDGMTQYQCVQVPQVLPEPGDPGKELRIGCSMTPGSSGGPWIATVDGVTMIVGNSSGIDDSRHWLMATVLSDGARQLYTAASTYSG